MDGHVTVNGLVERTSTEIELEAIEFGKSRVDISSTIPINVELMLEKTKNVKLATMDGLVYRHSVEGCVCSQFMSPVLTVYVDTNIANESTDLTNPLALAKYYAVLGEELAHIVLHRGIIMQIEDVYDFLAVRRSSKWLQIEQDAEQFSAAFRMPAKSLHVEAAAMYAAVVADEGFADPMKISEIVSIELTKKYLVTASEMQKRLANWPCQLLPAIIASAQLRSLTLVTESRVFSDLLLRVNRQAQFAKSFGLNN